MPKNKTISDMPEDYPKIDLSVKESQLKAIKDWEVGEEYTIKLKVKQTGAHENTDGSQTAEFEILKMSSGDKPAFLKGFDKER